MDQRTKAIEKDEVVIRFSGDSGDGMQLTGTLFADTSALEGLDVSTFPDYPSEIRAPQGTVAGVSGFQFQIGKNANTPGDYSDVLVAMNPAALKANAKWVKEGGTIIIDIDSFTAGNLAKAGFKEDPLTDKKFSSIKIIQAPITSLTKESLKDLNLDNKSILRSKNMFALGITYWIFNKPLHHTEKYFEEKFKKDPLLIESNKRVLHSGYNYAMNIQAVAPSYKVAPAVIVKGKYRNIAGNASTAWGLMAAAEKAGMKLFCGSYPITPATEILQELSLRKDLGVITIQCEDEIAGICTSIGASFAGCLSVTTTSGPGLALKSEAIGLAVMMEIPLVVVDVQRGGPSTGLPTKSEQADLFQALYGRNGESPVVVIAASRPNNCFDYAFMACKIALEHSVPVILMTDGFIANGAEPWRIPQMSDYPEIKPRIVSSDTKDWKPYFRDEEKLARTWAIPGTKGFEHRIGGLEKDYITGNVSHDPDNHERMVRVREEKVQRVANFIPELKVEGDENADILVIGWGGTYGHLITAVEELIEEGKKVAHAHFHYINPLPKNTAEIFSKYKKLVVCELNLGQFASYLRMKHQKFEYSQINKIHGQPFTIVELKDKITKIMEGK